MRRFLSLGIILLCGVSAATSDELKCASCHPAESHAQSHTAMARALQIPGTNAILPMHRDMSVVKGPYTYRVATRGSVTTYSVSDGVNEISAPLKWAFGDNNQTFVLEYGGRTYESLVSYYADIKGLDTTLGDQDFRPATLLKAFGREINSAIPDGCFGCHSSRGIDHNLVSLTKLVPGITCDRCHTGAIQHQDAALRGKRDFIPARLSQLRPFEVSEFCGQCHRTWESVMRIPNPGLVDVRFQPYRLANSQCFDGGDKRLSCLTCHNPHEAAMPSPAEVDAKCLDCHSATSQRPPRVAAKVCSVGTSDCASCHMPKIQLPGGHKTATDHEIRIVREGAPFPD